MFDKLRQLDNRYSVLQAKLNAPETYDDPRLVADLNRELRELEEVVTAYRAWETCDRACRESEELLHSEDPELREYAALVKVDRLRPCPAIIRRADQPARTPRTHPQEHYPGTVRHPRQIRLAESLRSR